MEYCLGDGDGSATIWTAAPDTDVDGDGALDAVGLDFDGDGLLDDAMADLDGDGVADHLVRDRRRRGRLLHRRRDGHLGGQRRTGLGPACGGSASTASSSPAARWSMSTPTVRPTTELLDADGDGLADRALSGEQAYVDTDGDGRWDIRLTDSDGDGRPTGPTSCHDNCSRSSFASLKSGVSNPSVNQL